MRAIFIFIAMTLITGSYNAWPKQRHAASGENKATIKPGGIDFIENKGQWTDEIHYKAQLSNGVVFLTDSGFVYHFVKVEDVYNLKRAGAQNKNYTDTLHSFAYKVKFGNCRNSAGFNPDEKRTYYHNYYNAADPKKWQGNVSIYGKVVREEIYKGINVEFYSMGDHLKFDFKVEKGADVTQIQLVYEGVTPYLADDGTLHIKTSINEIIEKAPYSYQIIDGEKIKVDARYKVNGHTVTFEFPDGFDRDKTLIIDPELVFATFSGAVVPAGDISYRCPEAYATTYDHIGKLYSAVTVYDMGWPVTTGAIQATYTPGIMPFTLADDIAINVFNANGTQLVYATYFGGNNIDFPLTMVANEANELILAGGTCSSAEFPLTSGCFDSVYSGGTSVGILSGVDIFVSHFNGDGTALIGSTLLGGSGSELIPSANNMTQNQPQYIQGYVGIFNTGTPLNITCDPQGNIWLIANTESTDFPVTANAQEPVYVGGSGDLVLCKLNTTCSQLLYSSYMGGTGLDIGYQIEFNHQGNLVICGGTKSTDFPVTAGSLHTTAPGGDFDGFVSILNPANGMILKSTFLGTSDKDQAVMIAIDGNDNVYALGNSYGSYPITSGVFSMTGGDVFLDKLNADLSVSLASTTLGGPQPKRLHPSGFTYTDCGEVLLSISMFHDPSQITDLPCTPNAIMSDTAQFWFCTMPDDFSAISYGSYFGPEYTPPSGFTVNYLFLAKGFTRYDPAGVIYHSFSCYNTGLSTGFPTTSSSWAPTSSFFGVSPAILWLPQDVASFKISFGFNSDFVLDVNTNDSGCAPYTVQFSNISLGANSFIWDFGDGSPPDYSVVPPPHTYTTPGTYIVSLIASSDSACVTSDTAFLPITVVPAAVQPSISVNDTLICSAAQAIDLTVLINNPNANFTINWSPSSGLLSPADQAVVTVDPYMNSIFYVTVTDDRFGLCSATVTDSIQITVAPNLIELLTQDTVVCEGSSIQVQATGNPLYHYSWIPTTGLSDSSILDPVIFVTQPENYTIYATYPGCPDTMLNLNIGMDYIPTVTLSPDKEVCPGIDVALESVVAPYRNDYIYTWSPANQALSNPNGPNTHFVADTTITYTLRVNTPIGCSGLDSVVIRVHPGVQGAVTSDTGICPGNEVVLSASGGTTYRWSPSDGLSDTDSANTTASPETQVDYTVVITNQYLCSDTEKVNVSVYPNAVLNMEDSVNIYPGESYHLEPGTNCSYFSWFPPSGINDTYVSDPVFNPEVRTRYFVTARTEAGCTVIDSIDILVKETVIDIPNAFNPSGDNNIFKPSKRGIAYLKSFEIYNRWGNKVYSSANIDEGWDGTYNGRPQPMGVYIYKIEAVTDNGFVFRKQGNVTLLR